MAVNTLVTGMIVFRILKVTGAGPSTLTGGNKLQHIMFIIIESGMVLFAIQLVRIVLASISVPVEQGPFKLFEAGYALVIRINEMLNVIYKIYLFILLLFF